MALTPRAKTTLIALALAALVLELYSAVGQHDFVDFDDGAYVYDNPHVSAGLTASGFTWALTALHSANWHPLTWLSHMLDVQLFGLDAGAHHWVSVVFHAANTVLVFLVLRALTGAQWRSAFVAALFGLHPLHVESVAWIAERKDVLSTLFLLLTIGAYARYVRRPTIGRHLLVVIAFALGLMAKPMLVTLPALLLLLDFWPLARWTPGRDGAWTRLKPLLAEKLPLMALSLASCAVTLRAQAASAATGSSEFYPLDERLSNAVVAYGTYLWKTVWPAELGVFYPHPSTTGAGVQVVALALAAVALAALNALAVWQRRRRPYIAFGWLWFVGTLVPVIGLVQVGSQAYADRYTYVPLIGVFVAVAWGAEELLAARPGGRGALAFGATASLAALAAVSWNQIATWSDSTTLYRRAIDVTDDNWLALNNLGNQYLGSGRIDDAQRCFERSLRIFPGYAEAWYNSGNVHMARMERDKAVDAYKKALALDERNLDGWNNLGVAYLNLGKYPEALAAIERALQLDGQDGKALQNLALTYALQGEREKLAEAERRLREADPARADELKAQLEALRK